MNASYFQHVIPTHLRLGHAGFKHILNSVLATGLVTSAAWAQAPVVPAAPAGGAGALPAVEGLLPRQGDPQVLDAGPIHEAFAEPVALDAKPRMIVNREPPQPINELPPEVKPERPQTRVID